MRNARAHRAVHDDRADRAEVEQRARAPSTRSPARCREHVPRPCVQLRTSASCVRSGSRAAARSSPTCTAAPRRLPTARAAGARRARPPRRPPPAARTRPGRSCPARPRAPSTTIERRCGASRPGSASVSSAEQVDVVVDPVAGDDRRQLGVGDHERQLDRAVAGVDRHDHGARQRDPVEASRRCRGCWPSGTPTLLAAPHAERRSGRARARGPARPARRRSHAGRGRRARRRPARAARSAAAGRRC